MHLTTKLSITVDNKEAREHILITLSGHLRDNLVHAVNFKCHQIIFSCLCFKIREIFLLSGPNLEIHYNLILQKYTSFQTCHCFL